MPKINYAHPTVVNSTFFSAAASNFRQRGKSLKGDIQHVLLHGLRHMDACGDYTSSILVILDAVKDACGKNLHVAATEWVLAYSWLAFDGKALVKDKTKVMAIAEAEKCDWWTKEPAPKSTPFDLQKALTTLFDKIAAEVKAERLDVGTVTHGLTGKLLEFNPTLAFDLFAEMSDKSKAEFMQVAVAAMTPAAPEVEQTEQQQMAA